MIKKLFLILLIAVPALLKAQNPCGTIQTEADLAWLRNFQANHIPGESRSGETYFVPIKVHIVGTDAGEGYINVSTVMQNICDLNVQFEPAGFIFYLFEDVHYINKSIYYNHDWDDGYSMMALNNDPDAVNMYFVGDPAGNCGYFSPAGNAVAIANGCGGIGNSTIAHELGHYFSLPHTFYGWEWGDPPISDQEQVDGGNCNSAADGFCDTPADYASWRWFCSSAPLFTDPDGVDFNPDGTYFMSYSDDNCQDKFSPDQMDAMTEYLTGPKDYLLENPTVNFTDVDTSELLLPFDEEENLFSNYAELSWSPVENAQGYVVQVSYTPSFTAMKYDVFTTETSFICTDLVHDQKYYWRVKVIGEANTCEGASPYRIFYTGSETLTTLEGNDALKAFTVYPNPANSGEVINLNILAEAGKNETVLVKDFTGKIIVSKNFTATGTLQTIPVELPGIASGIYIVQVTDGDIPALKKLLVTE
ncbi:MAG: T9SS type A sorting domain-containing protein [Chitinophagales bacterium]